MTAWLEGVGWGALFVVVSVVVDWAWFWLTVPAA